MIRHESDGLLVKCGDVDGLAAALLRLEGDGELRRRLGAAGRERTRTEFDWEDKLRMVRRVYEALRTACAANNGWRGGGRPSGRLIG